MVVEGSSYWWCVWVDSGRLMVRVRVVIFMEWLVKCLRENDMVGFLFWLILLGS